MWNLSRYKKICFFSEKIQKKNKNLLSICNPYLHIIRAHPFILDKYKDVFLKKSFIFYVISFFKNILEMKIKFLAQFFYKENINDNKNKYKILVLGHITNFDSFSKNIDFQYGNFFKENKDDIFYFYINSSKNKNDKVISKKKFKNIKKNFFIFNYKVTTLIFFKYIFTLSIGFIKAICHFLKIKKTNLYERKFLLNTALNIMTHSTLQNLIFYYKFLFFVKKYSIKKIVTTFEGHPFEKLIFKIGKENSIPVDAYQHSFISKTHHSIYVYTSNKYQPTRILASGKNTYKIFKSYFYPKIDVKLIGSTKFKKYNIKPKKYNYFKCLVVPEGFYEETSLLIRFCLDYIKKYNNVEFIVRLHPEVSKEKLIKMNPNCNFKSKYFKISDNKIHDDAKSCNLLLYRGSTFAADAIGLGLKPFYLKKHNEIEIDSLWMFKDKFKEKINNIYQFNKSILKIKNKKNSINIQKKTNEFSENFYGKFNYQITI